MSGRNAKLLRRTEPKYGATMGSPGKIRKAAKRVFLALSQAGRAQRRRLSPSRLAR